MPKFTISVIARDINWHAANNTTAVLVLRGEGEWLAMDARDARRAKHFAMTELLELRVTEESKRGWTFAFHPIKAELVEEVSGLGRRLLRWVGYAC